MGFSDAVAAALGRYATFRGRARRAEYWWFVLFTVGTSLIGSALDMLFGFDEVGVFGTLFALALLVPGIAVLVRRLHDIDRSGWSALALFLPPALAALVGVAAGGELGIAVGFAVTLALYGTAIYFLTRPGTAGPNRFGDDPKATPQPWGTTARNSGL